MNVLYICDGKNIHCSKTLCKYNGTGECNHTMSESYAKHGVAEKITADRFIICDDMAIEIDREDSQPKMGYWEWVQYDSNPTIGNWHCSECRTIIPDMPGETDNTPIYKWCPMCGCKMQEVEG